MADLDPRIIQSARPLTDISNAVQSGLQMKNLYMQTKQAGQEFKDNQDTRTAMQNSVQTDPATGTQSINRQSMLSDLYKTNPMAAMKAQQNFMQQDMQNAKARLDMAHARMDFAGQQFRMVNDQSSYDMALKSMQANGMDTSTAPRQYDQAYVNRMRDQTMTWKEQLETQIKQQESQNKKTELDMQMRREFGSPIPGQSSNASPQTDANGLSTQDPAELVRHLPQHLQQKAFEEIKDRQNITKIAQPALEAFDKAAKEVRPLTGGTSTSPTAFVPSHIPFVGDTQSYSPAQKAWMGMVNTTIKETEGTARQAAFDSVRKNFMPQFGDSDATVASKRESFIDYLKSHAASPVAKSGKIDLDKYTSTAINFGNKKAGGSGAAKEGDSYTDDNGAKWVVQGAHWVKQNSKVAGQ
jgi:hypothetical protein